MNFVIIAVNKICFYAILKLFEAGKSIFLVIDCMAKMMKERELIFLFI